MIRSYISAIKHVLRCDEYTWNDDGMMLSTITRSCKLINDTVRIRLPISRKLLDLMLVKMSRIFSTQPYLKIMYHVLFILGYYGLMRIGELTSGTHPILAKDVHVSDEKDKILLVLHSSKTHGKESRPLKIKIESLHYCRHSALFCPFATVCNYITVRGQYITKTEPFFVFSSRDPVTPPQVRKILQDVFEILNLDATLYGMHSLRSGRATDMYKMGYSISEIKMAGRWQSGAVYKYLKP